jgi:hypothetical protein
MSILSRLFHRPSPVEIAGAYRGTGFGVTAAVGRSAKEAALAAVVEDYPGADDVTVEQYCRAFVQAAEAERQAREAQHTAYLQEISRKRGKR